MKNTKTSLILVLAGAVTFSVVLWLYSTRKELNFLEIAVAIGVAIVVLASLFIGKRRLKDEKQGLPADDELSILIKQRAAAGAFMVSIFMWTFIILAFADSDISADVLISSGILGMALIFFSLWFYHSKKGMKND